MNSFDGRVVLVTGGTGGLGVAVVKSFLAGGAEVVVPNPDASLGGPLTEVKSDRLQIIASVDLAFTRSPPLHRAEPRAARTP